MKHTLLAIALLTALNANATWPSQGGNALTQSQSQTQSANGGNAQNGVSVDNPRQFPIMPSAIAPSQSVNTICQIASPQADAVSFLFIVSMSKTSGVIYNDLCYAYARGQYDVADKLMCAYSAEYKKANKDCK